MQDDTKQGNTRRKPDGKCPMVLKVIVIYRLNKVFCRECYFAKSTLEPKQIFLRMLMF